MRRVAIPCATVAILGLALLLASAAPAGSPAPSADGGEVVYRVGTTQDFDGLNPFADRSGITWESFMISYDFLTWYDEDYEPAPDLATEWTTSDDGTVWTFTIRQGMTWHDGEPLTAHDIAFTYNRVLETEAGAYIHYLEGVETVEAPDDTTLVISCEEPRAGMLALHIPIVPEHIWSNVPADEQEAFENVPLIGSGPFQVVEAAKSDYVKLAPNPAYPEQLGGPPKIDALYYVVAQNADAMVQDYKAGRLDAIVGWPGSCYDDLETQPGGAASAAPGIGFHELGFNCWDAPDSKGSPLLLDPAVRAAIHWAIDKQDIVDAAMDGLAVPGEAVVSPVQGVWHWEVPEDHRYAHDPAKAMQILEDAGYSDGDGDGVRENADGDALEFRLAVFNEYPEDQAAAEKIVAWCRDVGIKLDLDQKDERAFSDELRGGADYDLFVRSRGGDVDPGSMLSAFTTDQIFDKSDSRYSNREYDRMYAEQSQAVDPADPGDPSPRKAVTDQMQAILHRDNPYIVLWYTTHLQAWRTDRWTGYRLVPPGDEGAPLWNMLRTTYQDLGPVAAETTAEEGSSSWVWFVVAAVALVAVVAVMAMRGRSPKVEVE